MLSLNYLRWEAVAVVMVILAVKIYFTVDDGEKEESMNSCAQKQGCGQMSWGLVLL